MVWTLRSRIASVALLTACFMPLGCGGDDGDDGGDEASVDAEIRAAIDDYKEAVVTEDFAAACTHLTERAKQETLEVVPVADSCEAAHAEIRAVVPDAAIEDLADASVTVLSTAGNRGKVKIEGNTDAGDLVFSVRRAGGRWKFDQTPLQAPGSP